MNDEHCLDPLHCSVEHKKKKLVISLIKNKKQLRYFIVHLSISNYKMLMSF